LKINPTGEAADQTGIGPRKGRMQNLIPKLTTVLVYRARGGMATIQWELFDLCTAPNLLPTVRPVVRMVRNRGYVTQQKSTTTCASNLKIVPVKQN